MTTYQIYKAGDLIPRGDLIRTYILHLTTPIDQQDVFWHTDECMMRVVLNETSIEIPKLPGTIEVKI